MAARWWILLPLGLLLAACGSGKNDRIRELEERVEQLEDENAQLRKGIVPPDAAAPAVPVDPGDAPAWGATPGSPEEDVEEAPPPADIVPVTPGAADGEPAATAPPAAAEAPTPAPAAPSSGGGDAALVVYRAAMARDVADRQPVGEATSFPVGAGKVYCYSEVGPAPGVGQTELIHHWYHDGESLGATRLRVAGDHWRTYSNRTLTAERRGSWRVDLVDEHGNVLRSLPFTVE